MGGSASSEKSRLDAVDGGAAPVGTTPAGIAGAPLDRAAAPIDVSVTAIESVPIVVTTRRPVRCVLTKS